MNIGNSPEVWWNNLKIGDVFKVIKEIPYKNPIGSMAICNKGNYVYITGAKMHIRTRSNNSFNNEIKRISCTKYESKDLRVTLGSMVLWDWTPEYMKEYLVKVDLNESVNFERGKDPLDAMNIGNVKERQLRHISKLFQPYMDAIKEVQAELREQSTKGRIKRIRIADDDFTDIREYYIEFEFHYRGYELYCSIGLKDPNDIANDINIPDKIITKEEALPKIKQWISKWQLEMDKDLKK
jgi:hypothetical protein